MYKNKKAFCGSCGAKGSIKDLNIITLGDEHCGIGDIIPIEQINKIKK